MKTLSTTPITAAAEVWFREDTAGEPPALIPYVPAGTAAQLERRMRELEAACKAVVNEHDAQAIACNFKSCGCVSCAPLKAVLANAIINADGTPA